MISSGIDPQMAASKADSQDLIRFKQQMDGLKERLADDSAGKAKQLRAACENFEAVFISKLWKEMQSTVPKEGYLHSKQEDMYMSMFDKEFAEKMSRSGGIGLADMIYDQLSQKLKETSESVLPGGVAVKPLKAEPIALAKQEPIALDRSQGMTLEDWGGESAVAGTGPDEAVATTVGSGVSTTPVMNDLDVQSKLDALARKLEARRIREGLLGVRGGYGNDTTGSSEKRLGLNIAEIG